jgi:hypothetical protein
MTSKALHDLLGLKADSIPKEVTEVWDNLTVTKAIGAFVALFVVVPRLFEVRLSR